jgi:hypothetical protein
MLRFHSTLIRIATNNTNNKYWQGCGEKEPSYTVGGHVSYYNCYRKQYGGSSKN